ncbi:MAG TPA: filamentous hemagglutinin N-terminal domain-containing protein [Coleofasciculaceae cyanobacterium]
MKSRSIGWLGGMAIAGLMLGPEPGRSQILPDRAQGATETAIQGNCATACTITGGIAAQRNLFHSFQTFNVRDGAIVQFADPGVRHILVRVTGGSPSAIRGRLEVVGDANLFLLNPSGIVFGANASLDLRGSFVASTADSIRFGDRGSFSAAHPQSPALLTVNPSAVWFSAGSGTLKHRSTAGLRVLPGQNLLLLGGEVQIERGQIDSPGSHVDLGGLANAGEVQIDDRSANWRLRFSSQAVKANVRLSSGLVEVSSGSLEVQARSLDLSAGSILSASLFSADAAAGGEPAGNITLNVQDRVRITQNSVLTSETLGAGNAGNISIRAGNAMTVRQGSTISTATLGSGSAGRIEIIARTLRLEDNVLLTAKTAASGGAGQIVIRASEGVQITGFSTLSTSGSFSSTSLGDAGSITLQTDRLTLTDGGSIVTKIDETGRQQGEGGNIDLTARSILLSNRSEISAQTAATNGGNLTFRGVNLLWLDRQSLLSASAGAVRGSGNGGNIAIAAQFLVADPFGNSDITANADAGNGGQVVFAGQQIFGIEPRDRLTPRSDITVTSRFGASGTVTLNRLATDPSRGLSALPAQLRDASGLIAPNCRLSSRDRSELIITGQGGLPPTPADFRGSDAALTDWAMGDDLSDRVLLPQQAEPDLPASNVPTEAKSWVVTPEGKVVLQAGSGLLPSSSNPTCRPIPPAYSAQ